MKLSGADIERARLNGIARSTLYGRIKRGWDLEKSINNPAWVRPDKDLDDVITPEHYAQGEANGVSRENVWQRVNNSGWTIEKAITEPVLPKGTYKRESKYGEYVKIAEHNGIPFKTFWARINQMGWDVHKASTTPVRKKRTT